MRASSRSSRRSVCGTWFQVSRVTGEDLEKKVLAYNTVDQSRYKSEHVDGDNFAVCLAGDVSQRWDVNDIGVVLNVSAGHAYNCVLVSEDGKVDLRTVEPQTDQ